MSAIHHKIFDHVYGSHLVLLVGNREDLKVAATGYDPKFDGDMDFVGRCIEVHNHHDTGEHLVIVMLAEWSIFMNPSPKDIATLAHELFHATAFVMQEHDIDYCDETQEAWAYYFDSLLRRALEVLS